MPATLGDHRGVIKAAVTVVNRAANKGSEGTAGGGGGNGGGRDGKDVGGGGLIGDCLPFCRLLFFFFSFPQRLSRCGEIYLKKMVWFEPEQMIQLFIFCINFNSNLQNEE